MRIGMGYDVHKLVEGRDLIIGGIKIPYEKGLLGHSDADVLLHAISDALLGAAAMGDIGKHFPDTDERFAGADSLNLLAMVGAMLEAECYMIENIDATIIAQAPKMRPYIDRMRENIAAALGIDVSQVSVKATTEEGLGFTGSGEGISAQAICLLNTPREFATMDMANVNMQDLNGTFEVNFDEAEAGNGAASCDASSCTRCPMSSGCGRKVNS
ncbi:MAG: 2-C-methyl-D-erythritol 2,4-cyclodiphosphate synthase [Lachnospiraceae bacterium]|nr:2-C-methyl-D-erythritol 2,4-cyclodiphosphate synthase [Lachnospiraceae bacterium]